MCHENREGFVGWMGIGGSTFLFHPERKIAFSYVPSHISLVEIFAAKSHEIEHIVQQCQDGTYKEPIQDGCCTTF